MSLPASPQRSLGARKDIVSSFALTDVPHLNALWAATDKIQFQFDLDRSRSDFRGYPGCLPSAYVAQRKDNGSTPSLGSSYQLTLMAPMDHPAS
jgi:hypothetical protein